MKAKDKRFEWILNEKLRGVEGKTPTDFLSQDEIDKVQKYHSKIEGYEPTPLIDLRDLAEYYGVDKIFIKDESHRLGLNAFKVLGAAYAIGKRLAEKLEMDIEDLSFEELKSEDIRKKVGKITFTTATDGNHGRAVAWVAQQLGHKAVIYMPKGTSEERVNAILETGAKAHVTVLDYDETVFLAAECADKYGWELIQDTSWEAYEKIPTWIMQGYATIAQEVQNQLNELEIEQPTHIFLQAGVGSFAGAIQGYYAELFKDFRPVTMIVEPKKANCIYKSVEINDGKPHAVISDLNTIMAGLACGKPSPLGWNILRDYSDAYFSCEDYVAERGMRILYNPLGDDERIISGESGAVGVGLLSLMMEDEDFQDLRERLMLSETSRILIISTEGATDQANYKRILWG